MENDLKQRHYEARIEELEKLDREAATHVETVIAMRTSFDGDPPLCGVERFRSCVDRGSRQERLARTRKQTFT